MTDGMDQFQEDGTRQDADPDRETRLPTGGIDVVPTQTQELPDSEGARLAEVLSRNGGNRAAAAAELGISKTTLWRRMKQYGVKDHYGT